MEWYPDWSGGICAILASGPSATRAQANAVRGCHLIVINRAWQLAPWADVLYACEGKWWRHGGEGYGQQALAEFAGMKVIHDDQDFQESRLRRIKIANESRFIMEPGTIGNGQNGGFQALNLAMHFGARRIMLLGYDMHNRGGLHFHEDHPAKMGNPAKETFRARWLPPFSDAAPLLKDVGIDVVNCTPGTDLNVFPKMEIDAALKNWKGELC